MRKLLLILALTFIASCNDKGKNSYTLQDFREPLRSHLQKIVNNGIFTYDSAYSFIEKNASMQELQKISNSEHPVLRITGLSIIMDREEKEGDFQLIMSRLDDSAILTFDDGEFGYNQRMIADDLLFKGKWKTEEQLTKTINEVITKHNNMKSAFYILHKIEPEIKYYPYIKEMAFRDRPFDEIEQALYRLASYKRSEDIKLIKEALFKNWWQLGDPSFNLMKEFPDTTYLEVLLKFCKGEYKKRLMGRSAYNGDILFYEDFFKAVASYTHDSANSILQNVIKDINNPRYFIDKEHMAHSLYTAIKRNYSDLYKDVLKELVSRSKIDTNYENKMLEWTPLNDDNEKPKWYRWY